MKKIIALLFMLCLIPLGALAAEDTTIVLRIGDPYMTVNGEETEIDPGRGTAPVIASERTLVPLRAVVEALGGELSWDSESQSVSTKINDTFGPEVILTVGNMRATVRTFVSYGDSARWETDSKKMDISPIIVNDRVMLPARFVMEELGCDVVWNSENQSTTIIMAANDETVIGSAGFCDIYLSDFNFMYNSFGQLYKLISDWENIPFSEEKTLGEYARQETLNQIKWNIAMEAEAKERGIYVSDSEIKEYKNLSNQVSFNSDSISNTYNYYLTELHTTDRAYENYSRILLLTGKLYNEVMHVTGECYATPEEAGYTDENYTKARHILIMVDEDTTDAEARAKAEEVIARLDAGEDFAALIEEYNEDPGMTRDPYYVFTYGEMVDEFYQGTRALEMEEYSHEPVRSDYGYHIIQRLPLSSAGDTRASEPQLNKLAENFDALINRRMEKMEFEIYDSIIDAALEAQR
ncbi:MAG: peptidylprolyl isomerase [Oscillospiraceae bacterium]|nr:peptidylprolyl isomerase [Oscillospiraceae bacterium]